MSPRRTGMLLERRLERRQWETIIEQIESIKREYTVLGDLSSLGNARRVRRGALRRAAEVLGHSPRVLVDVGAGPGDSVREAAGLLGPGYIVAVDPSPRLVSEACRGLEHVCDAVVAVAEHLPIRGRGADLATSFYAARDFQDLRLGVREMIRASRVVAIGDIFLPRNPVARLLVRAWVCVAAPLLAMLVAFLRGLSYRGICSTLRGWCSVEDLAALIQEEASRLGLGAAVEPRGIVLGGLGYVVAAAEEGPGGGDGGERGTLRHTPCPGAGGDGEAGGGYSYEGGAESGPVRGGR